MHARNGDPSHSPAPALLAALGAFLLRVTPVYDPDCFWHLHTGRYIATHRAIPWRDVFSHTAEGRPWVFVDALADLGLYGLYRLGGYPAVIVATAAVGALAAGLAVAAAQRIAVLPRHRTALALVVAPLLVAALVYRVTPRPQTLTLALLAAVLYLFASARESPRRLWALVPLVALWQNGHPSGILGLALGGAFAVGESVDAWRAGRPLPRAPWGVTLAAGVGLLATPHPIDRIAASFTHATDPVLATLISEWVSPFGLRPWSPALWALLALWAFCLGAVGPWRRALLPTWTLLVALGTGVLAVRAARFLSYGALGATPVALAGLGALYAWATEPPRPRATQRIGQAFLVAPILVGLGMCLGMARPWGVGIAPGVFPEGAARFVARTHPTGPMLNELETGGYLLWALEGRHPVFFDGRSWAVYPRDVALDALLLDARRLPDVVRRRGVGLAVLRTDQRAAWFEARPDWRLVYFDDTAVVAVRTEGNARLVAQHGYDTLRLGSWSADIARWSRDPSLRAEALRESARAVTEAPEAAYAWVLRTAALTAAGQSAEADRAAARAVALRGDLVAPRRALLLRCTVRGDTACVCAQVAWMTGRGVHNAASRATAAQHGCPVP